MRQKPINYFLYIFAFSIPYENWDPFGLAGTYSVTRLVGVVYVIVYLFSLGKSFNTKILNFFIPIIFLWLWLVLRGLFDINLYSFSPDKILNTTFLTNIIFMVLISFHISIEKHLFKKALIAFSFGCIILSLLFFLNLIPNIEYIDDRLLIFGTNSNDLSFIMTMSCIILLSMINDDLLKIGHKRFYLIPLFFPLLNTIAQSGSRGGFIVLFVGYFVYLILSNKTNKKKRLHLLVGILILIFSYNVLMNTQIMESRILDNERTSTFGGRLDIWEFLINNVKKNILFGIGFSEYEAITKSYFGFTRSAHNSFIYLTTVGGVLALYLFVKFTINIFRISWTFRTFNFSNLLLALFVMQIFNLNKSGSFFGEKQMWFIFACIIGNSIYQRSIITRKKAIKRNYENSLRNR